MPVIIPLYYYYGTLQLLLYHSFYNGLFVTLRLSIRRAAYANDLVKSGWIYVRASRATRARGIAQRGIAGTRRARIAGEKIRETARSRAHKFRRSAKVA